jgi:hypothetical protein
MKLERVLRKAVPFLLIVILIACLFSKPQKEGMKGVNHWYEKDHGKNAELSVVVPAGILAGTAIAGAHYMAQQSAVYEKQVKAQKSTQEYWERVAKNAKNNENVMGHTSENISSEAATITNDASNDSSYADVLDDVKE